MFLFGNTENMKFNIGKTFNSIQKTATYESSRFSFFLNKVTKLHNSKGD